MLFFSGLRFGSTIQFSCPIRTDERSLFYSSKGLSLDLLLYFKERFDLRELLRRFFRATIAYETQSAFGEPSLVLT